MFKGEMGISDGGCNLLLGTKLIEVTSNSFKMSSLGILNDQVYDLSSV